MVVVAVVDTGDDGAGRGGAGVSLDVMVVEVVETVVTEEGLI